MKPRICLFALMLGTQGMVQAQKLTSLDKVLMIGSLLIQGYQALRGSTAKKVDPDAKTVESFCFKNKMEEKITVKLSRRVEDEDIKKELVIQKDSKECTYNLPKGIYTYEVLLASKDTYKKGEYAVTEETLMTINHESCSAAMAAAKLFLKNNQR